MPMAMRVLQTSCLEHFEVCALCRHAGASTNAGTIFNWMHAITDNISNYIIIYCTTLPMYFPYTTLYQLYNYIPCFYRVYRVYRVYGIEFTVYRVYALRYRIIPVSDGQQQPAHACERPALGRRVDAQTTASTGPADGPPRRTAEREADDR